MFTQVVILGSGLATTAWRRDFPSGTALFEVDQTDMSAFKKQCLAHSGAQMDASKDPSGFKFPLKADSWGAVATDLMQPDWETDLEAKGFKRGTAPSYNLTWINADQEVDSPKHKAISMQLCRCELPLLSMSALRLYNGKPSNIRSSLLQVKML